MKLIIVFSEQLEIFCVYQEKSPLNQTGSDQIAMKILPSQDKAFS